MHLTGNVDLTLYGVETSQAKYLGLFKHDLRLPLEYADDANAILVLKRCIDSSEAIARALRAALIGIPCLADSKAAEAVQRYYSECEKRFYSVCYNTSGTPLSKQALIDYVDDISGIAIASFNAALSQVNLRSYEMAEAVKQQNYLYKAINSKKKEARS